MSKASEMEEQCKWNRWGNGEHPNFERAEWEQEVAENHTTLAYWDWVVQEVGIEEDMLSVLE